MLFKIISNIFEMKVPQITSLKTRKIRNGYLLLINFIRAQNHSL